MEAALSVETLAIPWSTTSGKKKSKNFWEIANKLLQPLPENFVQNDSAHFAGVRTLPDAFHSSGPDDFFSRNTNTGWRNCKSWLQSVYKDNIEDIWKVPDESFFSPWIVKTNFYMLVFFVSQVYCLSRTHVLIPASRV